MKKVCFLLILCLLLTGCTGVQPPAATVPVSASCTSGHIDGSNNGYCDRCNAFLLVIVDFYSLNDIHGKLSDADTHPGLDELSTYLTDARKGNDHTILLSAGDMWQGSPESNLTQGLIMTDWMNEMDFAAMVLGNHEYDWGEASIEANYKQADFPLLAINIYDRETNLRVSYCQSAAVVDLGAIQIGIIGAMGDCYSSISADKTQDVYFKTGDDLTELVKAESQRLRSDGVDYIVYLIHDGYTSSKSGTTAVGGNQLKSYYDIELSQGYVDLVFEGHTHQKYVLTDTYGVYHLQSGGDNEGISHVEVAINIANGKSTVQAAGLVSTSVYENREDHPVVNQLLDKYQDQISLSNQVLGINSAKRNSNFLRQVVADLYYEAGMARWGDKYNIALGGGFMSVRSPGYLAAGEVTYGGLYSLFPFDNQLVLCSIKGRDLLSRFYQNTDSRYFISYGDYGRQLKDNIDPDETYYVVVDTYSLLYGPNKLTEVERYDEHIYARDLLAQYAKNGGFL